MWYSIGKSKSHNIAIRLTWCSDDNMGICRYYTRIRSKLNRIIANPAERGSMVTNGDQSECWLHNLAFTNAIANVASSDGSDTLVLGQGDAVVKFSRGTKAPFIGFKYSVVDGLGTPHSMAISAAPGFEPLRAQGAHTPSELVSRDGEHAHRPVQTGTRPRAVCRAWTLSRRPR